MIKQMSIKQNNDHAKNTDESPAPTKLLQQKSKPDPANLQKNLPLPTQQPSLSSLQTSKRHSQLSSAKHHSKQSQLPAHTKSVAPSPHTLLPISIHQLQQKLLNLYLKQFMDITTFQTIQKGKQLIELIKQAPGSKQTSSIINKCFKLFKSNIPDAVLCAFQFFRELVQVGHWRITDVVEELLLMPMVQIIEYRSYVPHMERGNTYFLSQIHRYGQDEKTNHLIKIGSTFFRMVHEVLFVWGAHYFPGSNFSKMLETLSISKNIGFPQFPHQFRFYSQARVQLYKNLIEKNKKINLKQELQFKTKKQSSKPKDIATNQCNQQAQNSDAEKSFKKQPSANQKEQKSFLPFKNNNLKTSSTSTIDQLKPSLHAKIELTQQLLHQKPNQGAPKLQTIKQTNTQSKKQQHNKKKSEKSDDELQSIVFNKEVKKQQNQLFQKQKNVLSQQKTLQEYKRIKPNKIKAKKSTLSIYQSQKSIQTQKSKVQSFADAQNVLSMIQSVQKIEIYSPKEQKIIKNQPKSAENNKFLTKEVILGEAMKKKKENCQSLIVENGQTQSKGNEIEAQQTFRLIQKKSISIKGQQNHSIGIQNNQQVSTMRVMSSERERYIESVSDEQREGKTYPFGKTQAIQQNNISNYNHLPIKEFFQNELQNIKTSIIEGIKSDIIRILDQNTNSSPTHQNTHHTQNQQNKQIHHLILQQHCPTKSQQSEEKITSTPFVVNFPSNNLDPSTQAFEFIKKKFKTGKKLKNSSKLKRPSILLDEELTINHQQPHQIHIKQNFKQFQAISPKNLVQLGVNTEGPMQEQILDQIHSLKQKINLMTASMSRQNPLSVKRHNNFFGSATIEKSFLKTPIAINKNQLQNIDQSQNQTSSLRNTINVQKKKSKSKLSERRSSLEAALLHKAISRPQSCGYLLEEAFGGRGTLLFNAAINSVQKKRKSVMFC